MSRSPLALTRFAASLQGEVVRVRPVSGAFAGPSRLQPTGSVCVKDRYGPAALRGPALLGERKLAARWETWYALLTAIAGAGGASIVSSAAQQVMASAVVNTDNFPAVEIVAAGPLPAMTDDPTSQTSAPTEDGSTFCRRVSRPRHMLPPITPGCRAYGMSLDLRRMTITVTCSAPARTVADKSPRPITADRASFSVWPGCRRSGRWTGPAPHHGGTW